MEPAQPEGPFCQSCGMPMKKDGDFGTEADGSRSGEYCANCYQGGKFTQPALTLEQMRELVHDVLVNQLGMPEGDVKEITESYLPMLKRWRG